MKFRAMLKTLKDNAILFVLFLVLMGGSGALQYYGNGPISSLGSNLLAGFIGAAVTVYGIDFLIKRREERSLLPVRASSYEDVRVMTHWALDLWKTAYRVSVGDGAPKSWRDLFSSQCLNKIMISLDIRRPANVAPAAPWSTYLDHQMSKIHQHAEKVLERHAGCLDPDIHRAIYSIVYYQHFSIENLIAHDKAEGIPRPSNLGSYMPLITEWFDAIIHLHEWTVSMHAYLLSHQITNIHQPYEFSIIEKVVNPPARLDPAEVIEQCEKFKRWQGEKSAATQKS